MTSTIHTIRYPADRPPPPFGCRWCGTEHGGHGRRWIPGKGIHRWEQPTNAQILARMRARRAARLNAQPAQFHVATAQIADANTCPEPETTAPCRCYEPDADPYECEAENCTWEFSELNPFGGSRSVNVPSAEVSRTCGACGWRTSVWHVDDGSAEAELYDHVKEHHNGNSIPPAS